MSNRGIPAGALHNNYRHYYVAVDTTASNWRACLVDQMNRLRSPGILHVMKYNTLKEIERLHV